MDRRSWIQTILGLGALVAMPPVVEASQRPKFGLLTVEGHTAHTKTTGEFLRVSINGVDVTDRCCEADDIAGYVLLWCQDQETHRWDVANGAKHVGRDRWACKHHIEGDVVIAPGEKTKA